MEKLRTVDIKAVQEPYCQNNMVTGLSVMSRVIALDSGERRPRPATVIVDPELDMKELKQFNTAFETAWYIVACYMIGEGLTAKQFVREVRGPFRRCVLQKPSIVSL